MSWPELLSQVATVLITGVVAVLSARYGAKSSIAAAERQVQAALDVAEKNNLAALKRVQYEQTRVKREAIFSELYAAIKDLERKFPHVGVSMPAGAPPEEQKSTNSEFGDKVNEVRAYLDKNAIWLDDQSYQLTERLLGEYMGTLSQYAFFWSRIERPRGELGWNVSERERSFYYADQAAEVRDQSRSAIDPLLEAIPKYYKKSLSMQDSPTVPP